MVTPGSLFAQDFVSPVRIAHGAAAGEILVSDSRLQAVISNALDKKGRQVTISVPGRPVSVAYGWERYFVGNESTQTVDVLNRKGRRLYTLGGENFLIQRPSDIAVDIGQELVFVTDPINGRVLVFHRDGDLINTLPAAGQPPLYKPTGIAVDPVRGEVLVSDFGEPGGVFSSAKPAVNIYDYGGVQLASISGNSDGNYKFSRPQGLAVNEQGHVYVVDSVRGQVLVFDRDTKQGVTVIGSLGPGPGQLKLPLDILIEDESKDLHVTSNRNRRVEVFSGMGMLP